MTAGAWTFSATAADALEAGGSGAAGGGGAPGGIIPRGPREAHPREPFAPEAKPGRAARSLRRGEAAAPASHPHKGTPSGPLSRSAASLTGGKDTHRRVLTIPSIGAGEAGGAAAAPKPRPLPPFRQAQTHRQPSFSAPASFLEQPLRVRFPQENELRKRFKHIRRDCPRAGSALRPPRQTGAVRLGSAGSPAPHPGLSATSLTLTY